MRAAVLALLITGMAAVSSAAQAGETITYSYDAKGRLVKLIHSGTVNTGVTTTYTFDKADNRTNVKKTGA